MKKLTIVIFALTITSCKMNDSSLSATDEELNQQTYVDDCFSFLRPVVVVENDHWGPPSNQQPQLSGSAWRVDKGGCLTDRRGNIARPVAGTVTTNKVYLNRSGGEGEWESCQLSTLKGGRVTADCGGRTFDIGQTKKSEKDDMVYVDVGNRFEFEILLNPEGGNPTIWTRSMRSQKITATKAIGIIAVTQ